MTLSEFDSRIGQSLKGMKRRKHNLHSSFKKTSFQTIIIMKLIIACLSLGNLLAVASATSAQVNISTSQRSVMTKPCTLFKYEPASLGKEYLRTTAQWLCRVHLSDRVRTLIISIFPAFHVNDLTLYRLRSFIIASVRHQGFVTNSRYLRSIPS